MPRFYNLLFIVVFGSLLIAFTTEARSLGSPLEFSAYQKILWDFEPVTSLVTSSQGNLWVLDRGLEHGIKAGDLFTVYAAGTPVKDPETGQQIGKSSVPILLLEVERVENERSICRPLRFLHQGASVIGKKGKRGLLAIRFSDIRAGFLSIGTEGVSFRIQEHLRRDLPQLVWTTITLQKKGSFEPASMETQGVDLAFVLVKGELIVYGPGGRLLRQYPLLKGVASNATKFGPVFMPEGTVKADIGLFDTRLVGRLSFVARKVCANDIDGDGDVEVVALSKRSVVLTPYRGKGSSVVYEMTGPGRGVSLSCCEGKNWIVINILMDKVGLRSQLLFYDRQGIKVVQKDINLWLSFVDMDGDGSKETLLGQGYDPDTLFASDIYLLEPSKDGIRYEKIMKLPSGMNILSCIWMDLNHNELPELIFLDEDGRIRVYEQDQLLWTSRFRLVSSQKTGLDLVGIYNQAHAAAVIFPAEVSKGQWVLGSLFWKDGTYSTKELTEPFGLKVCGISIEPNRHLFMAGNGDTEVGSSTYLYRLEVTEARNSSSSR